MNSNITIRKGTLSDFPKFYRFFKKTIKHQFPEYNLATYHYLVEIDFARQSLRQQINKGNRYVYLALDGQNIVGHLLVGKVSGGVGFGIWLAVDSKYQHFGIATKLLAFWENDSLQYGSHALYLWAADRNLGFYKKKGFTLAGEFKKAWFGVDINLFYKILREPKEENYLQQKQDSKL